MAETPPPPTPAALERLHDACGRAVATMAELSRETEGDQVTYLRLVQAADAAHRECGRILGDAVDQARRMGASWAAVGDVLGISRQAAQQRFGRAQETRRGRREITGAHAFNEMRILADEGEAGYHLVGFGPLVLQVEASDHPWEHKRVTSLRGLSAVRPKLEADAWTYVGSWFPFHYFKRPKPTDP